MTRMIESCPYGGCIEDYVNLGNGDFGITTECYCEEVGELPFAPPANEVMDGV